jgi:dipeptidyl aminopeptidase/acylaminoacyl peptidase
MMRFPRVANPIVLAACFLFYGSPVAIAQSGLDKEKRPVTVADAIRMTRLADDSYFKGGPSAGRVAHFSPDGKHFVVVLRKGNLEQNTNEYSLLLYESSEVFRSPKPDRLLRMSSSSNRDAIKNVSWLEDNENVAFIGEGSDQNPAVYTLNVETKRLVKLTEHATPIVNYAISANGQKVVFAAEPAPRKIANTEPSREGIAITSQSLYSILSGDRYLYEPNLTEGEELFLKVTGESERPISVEDVVEDNGVLSFSPDGRYVVFAVMVRDVPGSWIGYQDKQIHEAVTEKRPSGTASRLSRFMLFDLEGGGTKPLLDAPNQDASLRWNTDSRGVVIGETFLPLEVADPKDAEARKQNTYNVEVRLPSRDIIKVFGKDLAKDNTASSSLDLTLEEDVNEPPCIFVRDLKTKQRTLLLDLNPQFAELKFAKVEPVSWKAADGHEVVGGLYLPVGFDPHTRYPLVIQTHGFDTERFWIDGPWSSAFAAQPLAGEKFVVIQVGGAKEGDDATYIDTEKEAARAMAAYEGAIDYLDARGMIDRNRVGIIGFSRTVFTVGYTLTHSKYRFSAALLVDGIDAGYFQYITFFPSFIGLSKEFEQMNGGTPWGTGLRTWIKTTPGFNLDKVNTPVRIVALGPVSVLEMWEWYSGLSRLQKPVDFIYLPDAPHLIVKPWERVVAQQGLVDWFRFWLKREEDPDPTKTEEYSRWRNLRELRESHTTSRHRN